LVFHCFQQSTKFLTRPNFNFSTPNSEYPWVVLGKVLTKNQRKNASRNFLEFGLTPPNWPLVETDISVANNPGLWWMIAGSVANNVGLSAHQLHLIPVDKCADCRFVGF
jgi:hypothetical protein